MISSKVVCCKHKNLLLWTVFCFPFLSARFIDNKNYEEIVFIFSIRCNQILIVIFFEIICRPVLKFNYLMLERRMIHPWMENLTKLKIFLYSHQSSLSTTVWWYRKFCADTENDAKRSNRMTNRAKERPGCSRHTVCTFLTLPPPITCCLQDNSP